MHELSIAQNIIAIVEEEMKKHSDNGTIKKILFKAGRMNAIIPESLKFGFDILKKDKDIVSKAELDIEEIPLRVKCKNCGSESNLDEPAFCCPECYSPDVEIISGKEMWIESIELEDVEDKTTENTEK